MTALRHLLSVFFTITRGSTMRKFLTGVLVAGLWGLVATPLEACHCRSSKCGPTTVCAPAQCGPAYIEQKVTAYRCQLMTRQVERMICKPHYSVIEEPRTWTEWVKVSTPVTCKECVPVQVWKEVPITYQVCEWYTEH